MAVNTERLYTLVRYMILYPGCNLVSRGDSWLLPSKLDETHSKKGDCIAAEGSTTVSCRLLYRELNNQSTALTMRRAAKSSNGTHGLVLDYRRFVHNLLHYDRSTTRIKSALGSVAPRDLAMSASRSIDLADVQQDAVSTGMTRLGVRRSFYGIQIQ